MRFIGQVRPRYAVINRELMEVGQDGDRQARRISIATCLKRCIAAAVDTNIRLLRFDKELTLTRQTQLVVRPLGQLLLANLNSRFLDHLS